MEANTMDEKIQLAHWMGDFSSRAQYAGAAAAGVLSFLNTYAAGIGVIVAILGFLMNWYYKRKSSRLEKEYYQKLEAKE